MPPGFALRIYVYQLNQKALKSKKLYSIAPQKKTIITVVFIEIEPDFGMVILSAVSTCDFMCKVARYVYLYN